MHEGVIMLDTHREQAFHYRRIRRKLWGQKPGKILWNKPILEEIIPEYPPIFSKSERILYAVCRHFDISKNELLCKRRAFRFLIPRQIATYLMRELNRTSFPEIGRKLGGQDHTTVMNSWRRIGDVLHTPEIATAIQIITLTIGEL